MLYLIYLRCLKKSLLAIAARHPVLLARIILALFLYVLFHPCGIFRKVRHQRFISATYRTSTKTKNSIQHINHKSIFHTGEICICSGLTILWSWRVCSIISLEYFSWSNSYKQVWTTLRVYCLNYTTSGYQYVILQIRRALKRLQTTWTKTATSDQQVPYKAGKCCIWYTSIEWKGPC